MCGVLDLDINIQDSKLTLGFRQVFPDNAPDVELPGHEFHYFQISRQGCRILQKERTHAERMLQYRYTKPEIL